MMKIGGVTMTFNDGYKIKEWKSHYDVYRKELDYYVIVDNGSDAGFLQLLRNTFPNEVIIERGTNGGCTAAYNDGIHYLLDETDSDYIAIIGNDIKTPEGCFPAMSSYMQENSGIGIVSTAILHKDSMVLDNFGHKISFLGVVEECHRGEDYSVIQGKKELTELVTGGFTMSTRSFYEKVGLQDEKLFMYGDELDTSFRAKKAGFLIAVTGETYAWHWHIKNPNAKAGGAASSYLFARNRVYLAKKHLSFFHVVFYFFFHAVINPLGLLIKGILKGKKEYFKHAKYKFVGGCNGLFGRMEKNKYTLF